VSRGKLVTVVLPAAMHHAGVPKEVREIVEHPEKKLVEVVEKRAAVDRAMFKGFVDRVMKSIEDDEPSEMHTALGLLRLDRTGPAKEDRPPRAAYARQEVGKGLVDNVIQKAAT
jgi:hypothetical protein